MTARRGRTDAPEVDSGESDSGPAPGHGSRVRKTDEQQDGTVAAGRGRASRRSFLRGLAAGGALAFATPTATQVTAAQADEGDVPPTFPSAIRLDRTAKAVTLPMYRGLDRAGRSLYFVVTEASHPEEVARRGINWSAKLLNALGTAAVQTVDRELQPPWARTQSPVTIGATPNFDPDDELRVSEATRAEYSPLLTVGAETSPRDVVYNAPHVANVTGRHPGVLRLDRDNMEVRLRLTEGFHEGNRILFTTTDASTETYASLGNATYAPALAAAPASGDRVLETSARESVFVVTNGPTGADNPQRQGTESTLRGEGDRLDIAVSDQVCPETGNPLSCSVMYSPLWDVHEVQWTAAAVGAGDRVRLTDHSDVIERYEGGAVESATPNGQTNPLLANVPASDALLNCSIVDVSGPD